MKFKRCKYSQLNLNDQLICLKLKVLPGCRDVMSTFLQSSPDHLKETRAQEVTAGLSDPLFNHKEPLLRPLQSHQTHFKVTAATSVFGSGRLT